MGKLKVYYGWTRIGNVRKKRALSVMFENEMLGCRSERGQRCLRTIQDTVFERLRTIQDTVFERYQTKDEEQDGRKQNRIFTEYSLSLDEKPINGSLERCLFINSEADKNHVSKAMRERISEALRKSFMFANPGYKEPSSQLELKSE